MELLGLARHDARLEMAYAPLAVVERSLKTSLAEIRSDLPEIAAPEPYSMSEIRSE